MPATYGRRLTIALDADLALQQRDKIRRLLVFAPYVGATHAAGRGADVRADMGLATDYRGREANSPAHDITRT